MAYGFGWRKAGIRRNVGKVMCICSGRRPIKTCMEGLANKGPSRGMVTAETGMNFSQELPPLFLGDTSLENSGSAFLVELSVVNLVGLRTPDNAAGLILVLREFYKKSATGVLQRCISEEGGHQVLAEIHGGLGGHHAAACVMPTMWLYLPRVEARLRGITAWWFCGKRGNLHTIPCTE